MRALAAGLIALATLAGLGAVAGAAPRTAASVRTSVWFAPLPRDTFVGRSLGFDGSRDFMDLFRAGAPWKSAAGHVEVFKLYAGWAANEAPLDDLRRIVSDLDRRGIALAVEDGALQSRDGCGSGVEGFVPPDEATTIASRIRASGGSLRFVALDSTFRFGSLYAGPGACHFTAEEAARQFSAYAAAARSVFPGVVVGDIESLPPEGNPSELVRWMDVFRTVTGRRLPFFHLDLGFRRLDWPEAARYLEQAARARGIPFGIIYDGEGSQRDGGGSDADWTAASEHRFVTFEAQYGGRPDQAVLQSWVDHPDLALPETAPSTFTWLVNRYARERTSMTLRQRGSQFTGVLASAGGTPLAGARIEVGAAPLDGIVSEYELSGTVPPGAATARVGLRVNTECDCAGPSDLALYEARYSDGLTPGNAVPEPTFGEGLARWSATGTAPIALEPSDRSTGAMLHLRAEREQTAVVDSAEFPVAAGSSFHLGLIARIAPFSRGSGYLQLAFFDSQGRKARRLIPLAPRSQPLGTVRTRRNGTFAFRTGSLPPGAKQVEAWFRGGGRFPAYASLRVR